LMWRRFVCKRKPKPLGEPRQLLAEKLRYSVGRETDIGATRGTARVLSDRSATEALSRDAESRGNGAAKVVPRHTVASCDVEDASLSS